MGKVWLGDVIDATLDEPATIPEDCVDGDDDLDGVTDATGWIVSLPTPVSNGKSLENDVDVADEFVAFVVRGLCEGFPAEDEDTVADNGFDVADEGRTTGISDFVEGFVIALDSMDAAPGPLPTAGTEPTCLVGTALEGPPSDGEDKAVADGEELLDDIVAALDATDAAPAPLPTAGTEPTCFEGRTLETEAACARGREVASEGIDLARVEVVAAKLSLIESGCCPTGAAGMED
ncbi:hypothetical protein MMC07_003501 [Pseudocyphellaria aurata]|nr:hypothetical protein [Pseudocyphellaria aurata]